MTTSRALAIITVATLPLAAFTVNGFLANRQDEGGTGTVDTFEGGTEELAAARKVAAEPAVDHTDPVGWGLPRTSRPADEPVEYQAAAALAAAGRTEAAKGDAIADVKASLTELGGLVADPSRAAIKALPGGQGQELLDSLLARRTGLERRQKWLEDRTDIARRIATAEGLLAGPPDGANEKKCLDEILAVEKRFPAVVEDDETTEPANSRTQSEERRLHTLRTRASFRQQFHEAMTAVDPREKRDRLDAFLASHGSAPDSRDAQLQDTAKAELGVAKLAVFKADAEQAQSAKLMAAALKKWLAEPPAGPDNRAAKGTLIVRTWLEGKVPEPPRPAEPAKLEGLQEAEVLVLAGGAEKTTMRMLAVFEEIEGDPGNWRYWLNSENALDPELPRGEGNATVENGKRPADVPVFIAIQKEYGRARANFLANPLSEDGAETFAEKSTELAERIRKHLDVKAHTRVNKQLYVDYDSFGQALQEACNRAAETAEEFAAVAKHEGLRSLVIP